MSSMVEIALERERTSRRSFAGYIKLANKTLRYLDRYNIDRVVESLDDPSDNIACFAAAIIAQAIRHKVEALQFERVSPPQRLILPLLRLVQRKRYWIRYAGLLVLGRCIKRFGNGNLSEEIQTTFSYLGGGDHGREIVRLVDDVLSLLATGVDDETERCGKLIAQ